MQCTFLGRSGSQMISTVPKSLRDATAYRFVIDMASLKT